jgi:hypothetical protein
LSYRCLGGTLQRRYYKCLYRIEPVPPITLLIIKAFCFKINIILEAVNSSSINCYLESIDASEMIEEQFKQRVSQEIDKIKDWVTIIEH